MNDKNCYTKEVLLDVLASYLRLIARNREEFPTVVLDDLYVSIKHVLMANEYNGKSRDKMDW